MIAACHVKLDILGKGKSTAYPSQTVFHNVCSGHTVLFLYVCDLGSKERHKTFYDKRALLGVVSYDAM